MMMRRLLLYLTLPYCCALTFSEVVNNFDKHPKVKALAHAQSAQELQGEIVSAWQDPNLQVSSTQVKEPQTNFKLAIMQALPLTSK